MSRKPSDKTLLRNATSRVRDLERQLSLCRQQLQAYRGRATKAEIEASDWRKRLDLLLARDPVTATPELERWRQQSLKSTGG